MVLRPDTNFSNLKDRRNTIFMARTFYLHYNSDSPLRNWPLTSRLVRVTVVVAGTILHVSVHLGLVRTQTLEVNFQHLDFKHIFLLDTFHLLPAAGSRPQIRFSVQFLHFGFFRSLTLFTLRRVTRF